MPGDSPMNGAPSGAGAVPLEFRNGVHGEPSGGRDSVKWTRRSDGVDGSGQ